MKLGTLNEKCILYFCTDLRISNCTSKIFQSQYYLRKVLYLLQKMSNFLSMEGLNETFEYLITDAKNNIPIICSVLKIKT